jgi:hypothetical protein
MLMFVNLIAIGVALFKGSIGKIRTLPKVITRRRYWMGYICATARKKIKNPDFRKNSSLGKRLYNHFDEVGS